MQVACALNFRISVSASRWSCSVTPDRINDSFNLVRRLRIESSGNVYLQRFAFGKILHSKA